MSDRRAPTPLFRRTLAACALLLLAATGATTARAAEVQWYVEILAAICLLYTSDAADES